MKKIYYNINHKQKNLYRGNLAATYIKANNRVSLRLK